MRYLVRLFLILIIVISGSVVSLATSVNQDEEETIDLPISDDLTYVVHPGDFLDLIAATFDVSLDCLRETNDLSTHP